jgi:uncharacterized protein (TIGR02246 family)
MGLGLLVGCQPVAEEPSEMEAPAAEEAVSDEDLLDAQAEAFEAAWAQGDAAALAALFTADGNTVGPEGVAFQGREAVQGRYQELLGGMYQGTTISIETTSTTFPAPDVAFVHGSYTIHGITNEDGEAMEADGVFMNVAVKQSGEWKIHSSRPMVPLPAPTAGT